MKINKRLQKNVNTAVKLSFRNGIIEKNAVSKYIKAFKSLPLNEAISSLSLYLKGLKLEAQKKTLEIESATPLSPTQVKQILNTLKKDFQISETKTLVNPQILGGVRVKIADQVFDSSIKDKIKQIGGIIHG